MLRSASYPPVIIGRTSTAARYAAATLRTIIFLFLSLGPLPIRIMRRVRRTQASLNIRDLVLHDSDRFGDDVLRWICAGGFDAVYKTRSEQKSAKSEATLALFNSQMK